MLVKYAIQEVRNKTNDKDEFNLDDNEILSYLNEAIQFIGLHLIAANSPVMLREYMIRERKFELPEDFVKTAGTYPVRITGNEGDLLGETPCRFRYFAMPPVVSYEDRMPLRKYALNQIAVKIACMHVSAQEQLDISQDKALLDEINAAVAGVLANVTLK